MRRGPKGDVGRLLLILARAGGARNSLLTPSQSAFHLPHKRSGRDHHSNLARAMLQFPATVTFPRAFETR
jgi:hypothetical protein